MVVQSLENREKSGNENFREKLEKSGSFPERAPNNFLYICIIRNNAFSDKNFHYIHQSSKVATLVCQGIFENFVWKAWKSQGK